MIVLAHVSSLEDDNGLTRFDSPRLAVHEERLLGNRGRSATCLQRRRAVKDASELNGFEDEKTSFGALRPW